MFKEEGNSMKTPEFKKYLKIFRFVIIYYCATYGYILKIFVDLCVSWCFFATYECIYKKTKNNLIFKIQIMSKKEFKRINLRVDSSLYNKIKKEADDSYLRIGTYIRQLIQKALKNNIIKN